MKRFIVAAVMLAFLAPRADACVGKILHIGVVDSSGGKVLAEMLAGIINERTGTTVAIQLYGTVQQLEEAVKAKQVDISIENTARAMQALNQPANSDVNRSFETVKAAYERDKGMVWLKPFGFLSGSGGEAPSYTSAVLRVEVLNNYPALPKVIGKVAVAVSDEAYLRLIKAVEAGEQPKKVARDYLKSKKLI